MTNNVNLAEKPADCQRLRAPRLTVFYCVNAGSPLDLGLASSGGSAEQIKLPCSAMVRDVFLLRAFEAGAEGVLVVACAPDRCKRGIGSAYAEKRVARTRKLLDEIGLGGWRLAFARPDEAEKTMRQLVVELTLHNTNSFSCGEAAHSEATP